MAILSTVLNVILANVLGIIGLLLIAFIAIGLIKIALKIFAGGLALTVIVTAIYLIVKFGGMLIAFVSPYVSLFVTSASAIIK